jgi:hypothetical protein
MLFVKELTTYIQLAADKFLGKLTSKNEAKHLNIHSLCITDVGLETI